MSRFYTHLRLPFETNMRHLATFKTDLRALGHTIRDASRLDTRLVKFLADLDIKASHVEAFYTPPMAVLPIHVDHDKFSDLVKMNFCYGGAGSTMNWWEMKDPNYEPTVRLTGVGTKYIYIDKNDVNLVDSTSIGQPTLVNVGRPHSINNNTQSMRWVLSMVLWCTREKRDLTLAEATERMKDFIV